MTETEIVRLLLDYYEGLFPKVCSNCGHTFGSLREYIISTKRLWPSVEYDIEMGNYVPVHPIGGLALANCNCGNTLALSSRTMPLEQTQLILDWIHTESERLEFTPTELLERLRDEVRRRTLGEPAQGVAAEVSAT
jgi:hypothetical protein